MCLFLYIFLVFFFFFGPVDARALHYHVFIEAFPVPRCLLPTIMAEVCLRRLASLHPAAWPCALPLPAEVARP